MDVIRVLCDVGIQNSDDIILSHIKNNIIPFSKKNQVYNFKILGNIQALENSNHNEEIPYEDTKFSDIKANPFMLKESYNLASIDHQFNITKHNSGALAPQLLKSQTYAICGSKNIAFVEYLQYRNELTYIYNLGTPYSDKIINISLINEERLYNLNTQNSHLENIYKDYEYYTNKIRKVDQDGIDVFISENYYSGGELVYQIMLMLKILKNNGDAIIKISLSNNKFINDIVKILSICFNEVYLFKTFLTNINNDYYYIVCKQFNFFDSLEISKLLKIILSKINYNSTPIELFSNKDEDVTKYIDQIKKLIDIERNFNSSLYVPQKAKIYLNIN